LGSFAGIKPINNMRYFIILFSILTIQIINTSCQSEEEKAWLKTMHSHDDIMLKMQENGELQTKLNEIISRAKLDSNSILFNHIDTLQIAYNSLSISDEEMMDWMAAIQAPKKGDDKDSILNYLSAQEHAIILVGKHMDMAADQAKNILKSLEK
jgi:hypothetical protein